MLQAMPPNIPLLVAARMGHLAIVQKLAAAGADINAIDLYDRSTALDYATYRRYTELAAWLSAAGARRAPQR